MNTSFYLSENSIRELFAFIESLGGIFIPDIKYNTANYVVLNTFEEFLHCQKTQTTHFFIMSKDVSFEPLELRQNQYINQTTFYISQRQGGPYIDFSYYRGFAKDATIPYQNAIIELYSQFIHYNSSDEFKTSENVRQFYNKISKFIKYKCKAITVGKIRHWIDKELQYPLN